MGAAVNGLQERTEIRDPVMLEWRMKMAERAALRDRINLLTREIRRLKVKLAIGLCLQCGKEFTRMRPTKLYCSQACSFTASNARGEQARRHFDVTAIREHLPMLRMMMTPISMRVLENLTTTDSLGITADSEGLTRQRISQIAAKATHLILAFRLAAHAQRTNGSASTAEAK